MQKHKEACLSLSLTMSLKIIYRALCSSSWVTKLRTSKGWMDRAVGQISIQEPTDAAFNLPRCWPESYQLPGNQADMRNMSEGFPVKPFLVFVLVCECCRSSLFAGAARKVGEFRGTEGSHEYGWPVCYIICIHPSLPMTPVCLGLPKRFKYARIGPRTFSSRPNYLI